MGIAILECKGPYKEGDVLLPKGMTIVGGDLHWEFDSNDYRLKVEHIDIPVTQRGGTYRRVEILYGQDEKGNQTIEGWELHEYT